MNFFLVTLFLPLLLECSAEIVLITISALPLKKISNFAFVTEDPINKVSQEIFNQSQAAF